jgi:cytochrome c peroxidase
MVRVNRAMRAALTGTGALVFALLTLTGHAAAAFSWNLPGWIPPPLEPPENRMTPAKVILGRHLFYDTRLSADQTMSCATCHQQARAFTDGRRTAAGVTGELGRRNTPSLTNVPYYPSFSWGNPFIDSLEAQVLRPIFGEHPVEMGMVGKEPLLSQRLEANPVYRKLFAEAFPETTRAPAERLYSRTVITRAVATFLRTFLSFNSPYDRYKYDNDKSAISAAAQRGESLFNSVKLDCYKCHGSLYFTDNVTHARMIAPERGFHNTGLYNEDGGGGYPRGHEGKAEFTGSAEDNGKFRTPSLRNVALTAPYMHDGSMATLEEVIRTHYAKGGRAVHAGKPANPRRSRFVHGFQISEQEVNDLVEFLKSLTDESFVRSPNFSNPWLP